MTGPAARDPLPAEPEHRDRWRDTASPAWLPIVLDYLEENGVDADSLLIQLGSSDHLRAAPSVPPQPAVPRAEAGFSSDDARRNPEWQRLIANANAEECRRLAVGTVQRAPVDALLAALHDVLLPDDVHYYAAELRRHLDTTTNQPEEGQ